MNKIGLALFIKSDSNKENKVQMKNINQQLFMKMRFFLFLSSIFLFCSCSSGSKTPLTTLPTVPVNEQTPNSPTLTPLSKKPNDTQLGGRIAFYDSKGVYLSNVDGTNIHLIQKIDLPFSMIDLSPSGDQLAYFQNNVVYIKDLNTEKLTPITHEDIGSVGGQLKWSPDATKLAFACSTAELPDGPICLLDVRTGVITKLLSADQFTNPRSFYFIELQDWSRDGTKIVFTYYTPPEKGQKEDFEIYLYDLNTKEIRKVLDGKMQESIAQLSKVTISPDNQILILAGAVSTSISQIFRINVDGTGFHPLTKDNQFSVENPVWSPQGLALFVSKRIPGPSGSITTELITLEGQILLSIPSVGTVFEWIK